MSMISGLIDELNKSADEWNGSNMFELARMCRDAADTIWQLRDDLQRANADNAKLREENERLKLFAKGDAIITDYWKDEDGTMHVLTTDGSSTYEYMRGGLAEENAELRELVRDYERCTMHADCSRCEYDGTMSTHCPLSPCFPDADELRELGVVE